MVEYMRRKEKLTIGEIYHVYNRSIANFEIFNKDTEYVKIREAIRYYQNEGTTASFSQVIKLKTIGMEAYLPKDQNNLVQIIAYCIMPTHLHLILKQLKKNGISIFMGKTLNSYSKYFNNKHKRKGPLWEGRFSAILIKGDDQLLHLTRYIHLNPVTAYLVDKPEDWLASSYNEYLSKIIKEERLCEFEDILEINPLSYREFVEDRIYYQRELAIIKQSLLE